MDYIGLSWTIWDYLELSGTIWDYLGLSWTILTILDYLGLSRTICDTKFENTKIDPLNDVCYFSTKFPNFQVIFRVRVYKFTRILESPIP